jgi:hypothetical protein
MKSIWDFIRIFANKTTEYETYTVSDAGNLLKVN